MEIFSPLSSFLVLMSLSPLLPQIAILGYQRWFQTCSVYYCSLSSSSISVFAYTKVITKKTPNTLSLFFRQSNCRSCSFSTSLNTNKKQNGALIVFAKMLYFLAGQAVSNICSFYCFFHILQSHKNNFLNTLKHWISQMDLISHLLFFVHLSNNIQLCCMFTQVIWMTIFRKHLYGVFVIS